MKAHCIDVIHPKRETGSTTHRVRQVLVVASSKREAMKLVAADTRDNTARLLYQTAFQPQTVFTFSSRRMKAEHVEKLENLVPPRTLARFGG